ncbi:MAG: Asp23/Gls24 family envelope stress response protein [Anaerolineae bacterium]|nr:Asp23/Gls24 family envelope stress response protein [Anaerolineae bacterium]
MNQQVNSRGRIEVSLVAIASLAHDAVLRSYGVVGTVEKSLATGIANVFSRESRRGVVVRLRNGAIVIDLYVIVEYGTRIASVARSAMNIVKYTVEKSIGVPVAEVNVHVEEIRVSSQD